MSPFVLRAMLARRMPPILEPGLALAAVAVPHRGVGTFLLGLPPLGVAIPSFWFGLLLVQVFSFTFFHVFPPSSVR